MLAAARTTPRKRIAGLDLEDELHHLVCQRDAGGFPRGQIERRRILGPQGQGYRARAESDELHYFVTVSVTVMMPFEENVTVSPSMNLRSVCITPIEKDAVCAGV